MTHVVPQLHRPALPDPDEVVFEKALRVNGRSYDIVIQSPGVQIATLPHIKLIADLFQAAVESHKGTPLEDIDATVLSSIQLSKQYGYCSITEPNPAQPDQRISYDGSERITPQWRQKLAPRLASSNTAWTRSAHKTAAIAIETILELQNDALVSISPHTGSTEAPSSRISSTPTSTEDSKAKWAAKKALSGAKTLGVGAAKNLVKPLKYAYDHFITDSAPKPKKLGGNLFGLIGGEYYEPMHEEKVDDERLNGRRDAIAAWIQGRRDLGAYQTFWQWLKQEIKTEATRYGERTAIDNFAAFLNGGNPGARVPQEDLWEHHKDRILN